jgi:DNA helicase-2/ATP-dependent DNA helicase PcrA
MFVWTPGELNPEQESAILDPESVFLVACPGSGKTRALTYKIAYEISRLKSDKHFVVAITYTNRAADEIHERVEHLGVDTSQLWIGTIHSFCLEWILKPYSIYHQTLSKGFRVINSHDSENILTELCRPYSRSRITYWDCGFYFTTEGYVLSCPDPSKHASVREILGQYFQSLSNNRQVDFELILFYANQLLDERPSISVLLSKLFPFILVDEYQDTKKIQYSIIASILRAGGGSTKIFIVGDPNQAIYQSLGGFAIAAGAFRAMAGIQLNERELSKNYRSPERVITYFRNFNVFDTTIESASEDSDYPSLVSYNKVVTKSLLDDELIRLIRYNIESVGIPPTEVCVLAPQWLHLSSMTRRLVSSMPEYQFDGPGMVPFSRDIENFWYKLSKIALTSASPEMYVRRLRWAGDVLKNLQDAGANVSKWTKKSFLRECNSITIVEADGLRYLTEFFDALLARLGISILSSPYLQEHHNAFFESSLSRIARLKKEGADFIGDIATFRRVFQERTGITVSTIHGIKGDEYDCVIAYALLEGMVPHFNDPNGEDGAKKLLYVICSRAKKNLHLISERERLYGRDREYPPTEILAACDFDYDDVP